MESINYVPEIYIGENGNWFINETNTGVHAQGEKRDTGAAGPKGDTGSQGLTGAQELTGVKGDTGARGPAPTIDGGIETSMVQVRVFLQMRTRQLRKR